MLELIRNYLFTIIKKDRGKHGMGTKILNEV
jgi:hypothetical protein